VCATSICYFQNNDSSIILLFFSEVTSGIGRADDEDEEPGPMIPDLDDVQEEDLALQVGIIT
jgi:hypothetical protein